MMRKTACGPAIAICVFYLLIGGFPGISAPEPADIPTDKLPRFHKVSGSLYRGGMPEEEGFKYLRDMGIKTVVNFRNEDDERPLVESLGMKYAPIPQTAEKGISDSGIREFFKVVGNPENGPVFVHCRRGADRTGALIAFYRIAFEGWDPERAYREARDIGLRWWHYTLKKQIRNFDPKSFSELIPKK